MALITPVVGATGTFVLKQPFNTKMPAEVIFTCESVRSIKDYIAQNQDVFEEIYKPVGLQQADYEAAIHANILIVALRAQEGQWIYVPADYIDQYPVVDGVMYRQIMFGISTPPIDGSVDLNDLKNQLKDLVTDYIGRDVQVDIMELSKPIMLTLDAHAAEKAIRDANISKQPPVLARIRNQQAIIDAQVNVIQDLENHILAQ